MGFFFKKKTTLAKQNESREDVARELNDLVYFLENRKYNNELNAVNIDEHAKELKQLAKQISNSVGFGSTDNTLGCEQVKTSVKELRKALNSNIMGRVDDAFFDLKLNVKQVLDYESGKISQMDIKGDFNDKSTRKAYAILTEMKEFRDKYAENMERSEQEIQKHERDQLELNNLLLKASTERREKDIYYKIKMKDRQIEDLTIFVDAYRNSENLIDRFITIANEFILTGDIIKDNVAKVFDNFNPADLKQYLTDPLRTQVILERVLKEVEALRTKSKKIEEANTRSLQDVGGDYSEIKEYKRKLLEKQAAETKLKEEVDEAKNSIQEIFNEKK